MRQGNPQDDFRARVKRVQAQAGRAAPAPQARRARDDDLSEHAFIGAVLRPQLAAVLGAVAMIVGRALCMRSLGLEPSTELLSMTEAGVVFVMLFGIGLAFGRSDVISHVALVVGASLAFLLEGWYVLLAPGLMEAIYGPDYVGRVILGLP